jgi:hypothetical protein
MISSRVRPISVRVGRGRLDLFLCSGYGMLVFGLRFALFRGTIIVLMAGWPRLVCWSSLTREQD